MGKKMGKKMGKQIQYNRINNTHLGTQILMHNRTQGFTPVVYTLSQEYFELLINSSASCSLYFTILFTRSLYSPCNLSICSCKMFSCISNAIMSSCNRSTCLFLC